MWDWAMRPAREVGVEGDRSLDGWRQPTTGKHNAIFRQCGGHQAAIYECFFTFLETGLKASIEIARSPTDVLGHTVPAFCWGQCRRSSLAPSAPAGQV